MSAAWARTGCGASAYPRSSHGLPVHTCARANSHTTHSAAMIATPLAPDRRNDGAQTQGAKAADGRPGGNNGKEEGEKQAEPGRRLVVEGRPPRHPIPNAPHGPRPPGQAGEAPRAGDRSWSATRNGTSATHASAET